MNDFAQASARKVLVVASFAPPEFLRGIVHHARERAWHLASDVMFTGALPREWRGAGAIIHLPCQPDLLAYVENLGLPCVVVDGGGQSRNLPAVEPDHAAVGRLAADYLLSQPHRGFAWAPACDDRGDGERFSAFETRLAEHGHLCRILPPRHARIGGALVNSWAAHRRLLTAELRQLPLPTAIFAANDCVAADVIDACHEAGLSVPEDIVVLGAGNSFACETSAVSFSSIDENQQELARRAALLLDELMEGAPRPAQPLRVPPKGVVSRHSMAPVAVKDRRVARALGYIAENYPDIMLTVNTVARAAGMSRRNLERSFREETGGTVHEHIIGARMREALRLLRTRPEATSAEVAARVGIAGIGTFFRMFRRVHGMSPKAYRHEIGSPLASRRTDLATLFPEADHQSGGRSAPPRFPAFSSRISGDVFPTQDTASLHAGH